MVKPIYEFLLWSNCKNNCKFCFQKQKQKEIPDSEKEKSIEKVISFINSEKFINGSHCLIAGGELFDNKNDFDKLYRIFSFVVGKMKKGYIDNLYINTNLIYKDKFLLFELLDVLENNNLFERVHFTTSYDIEGRFNENSRKLVIDNIKEIKEKYKKLTINVNMILTNSFCNAVLKKTFSVKKFAEDNKIYPNILPYINVTNQLVPTREKVLKTLSFIRNEMPDYFVGYVSNMLLNQKRNLYLYDWEKEVLINSACDDSICGHPENFKRYSEENKCFLCDLESLFCN